MSRLQDLIDLTVDGHIKESAQWELDRLYTLARLLEKIAATNSSKEFVDALSEAKEELQQ